MIATISGVFVSSGRANVIARDRDTGVQRNCFIFPTNDRSRDVMNLCKEASKPWGVKPTLVLTMSEPDSKGWHRLEEAEIYERGARTA